MPNHAESDHTRVLQDLPLPGHYQCLTLQLNVTRYQATRFGRWTLSVREPVDNFEVYRSFVDQGPWEEVSVPMAEALLEALASMCFLQDGYAHMRDEQARPSH